MKLGPPVILSYSEEEREDQEKVNERISSVVNKNFDQVYRALRSNASFNDNLYGILKEQLEVSHNITQRIPHRLGSVANNCLIFGGSCGGRIEILSSTSSLVTIRPILPHSFLTANVASSTAYVADPYAFRIGDKIVVAGAATTEYSITDIDYDTRELTLSASMTASQFDGVYVPSAKLNVFFF